MNSPAMLSLVWENLCGHSAWVQSRVSGMSVRSDGALLVVDSGLKSDTFNKVLLDPRSEAESGRELCPRIREAVSGFETAGRAFTLWTSEGAPCFPEQEEGDGAVLLEGLGFSAAEQETGMVANLAETPRGVLGAPVSRVRDEAGMAAFVTVLGANWEPADPDVETFFRRAAPLLLAENSPMRLFVVWAGDEPAACGELFLSADGQVAGVHMVATRREFRRQGFGSAATLAVLDAGRRAGAGLAVLLASVQGLPLYKRMGFQSCGGFVEYAPESETFPCG